PVGQPQDTGTHPDPKQPDPKASPGVPVTPAPKVGSSAAPVPELGSQPAVTTAPIPVPTAGRPGPGVQKEASYDEKKHVCQPEDKVFATVSKGVYGSEQYAEALIEYTRQHLLGKGAVREAPQLRRGLVVSLPPVAVLESRFGVPGQQPA